MPDPGAYRRTIAIGAGAIGISALIVLLGVLNPPVPSGISTDRLGPERGEPVADYPAQARDSLSGTDTDDHWALVSFTEYRTPDRIPAHSGGLRIGQVLHHVPIPRVHTPIVAVQVPAGDAVAVSSNRDAAWQLLDQLEHQRGADDRDARIMTVSIDRLRGGCACTVGLVVRGSLPQLRELADRDGVRAVQALPADAVAGSFAVVPLLPDYTDSAHPGPDDGPVPAR